MRPALSREAILPRIDGIQKNIQKLSSLGKLSPDKFEGDAYDLAQHHLRLALEGVFHISSHILSRLPGNRAREYKEVARKMGEVGIVPKSFANKALVAMAGMRNLLVHDYSEIKPQRLHQIINDHLNDIEIFLGHIKTLLQKPSRFNLTLF